MCDVWWQVFSFISALVYSYDTIIQFIDWLEVIISSIVSDHIPVTFVAHSAVGLKNIVCWETDM